jgi:formamidopyrimidine-DNA glycosylase
MPELPEVETIARQLRGVLVGKKILKIEVLRARSFVGEIKEIEGKTISEITRRSKVLQIGLGDYEKSLIIHLKMTGQLVWRGKNSRTQELKQVAGGHPSADWVADLPNSHTRIVFDLDDGSKLFFNDLRVFGWIKVIDNGQWTMEKSKLPPDVIDHGFSLEYFKKILVANKPIKLLILDQQKLGGMGNIYANDALFDSKIDPRRKSNTLTSNEATKLFNSMRMVIEKGIKMGGASAENFVHVSGLGGKYQDHFLVYKREKENCLICGSKIKKIKLGGRGTYYCPECQK